MTDEKLDQILKQALAPEINDREIRIDGRRKGKMKKLKKIGKFAVAAVAAVAIGIGVLGYFNPVFAAKIPLIGKIFEKVEDKAMYSGDYTDKATVLTNEDSVGNLDTSDYFASDKGIKLTASEVYCDGYSIFLTMNVEAADADFTHMVGQRFHISGTLCVNGKEEEMFHDLCDGEVIDSHTYVCMLKVELAEKAADRCELNLNVNCLSYDDDRMLNPEDNPGDNEASYWKEGNWNIVLPFEVNETDIKTIEVGETGGNITLEDVMVSPYQVIVHATTPGNGSSHYEPCYTSCFNQDGEMLDPDNMEVLGRFGFAVQKKEIEKLYIFVFDDFGNWLQSMDEGMNSSVMDKAVISKEIHVK